MRIFESRPGLRWLVPVALVGLVGGGSSLIAMTATAKASLPKQSAQQLLVDVEQAKVDNLQGTVTQTSDLGLPDLQGLGGSSSDTSLTSLISGTHTLKVWLSGQDKSRLAVLGKFGESDVIRNGKDVWTWSSDGNTATHRTLTADETAKKNVPTPTDAPKTPQEAAAHMLAAIDPTTEVTTARNVKVAGRLAYELVLTPKTKGSKLTQVRIAIDGVTHSPLRVRVFAQGADPVFEVAYTAVDFSAPQAANFRFNPRAGVKVTEVPAGTADRQLPSGKTPKTSTGKRPTADASASKPTIVGQGWATVIISKLPAGALTSTSKAGANRTGGPDLGRIMQSLTPVSGKWGSGRLLNGKAFSAVITNDGRIAVGAVNPQSLFDALNK